VVVNAMAQVTFDNDVIADVVDVHSGHPQSSFRNLNIASTSCPVLVFCKQEVADA